MQRTPLHDEYAAIAKVIDFHGWALPVQFAGIIEEHNHTRKSAGLFDCSHMGEFFIRGAHNLAALDRLVYSDYIGLAPGRCRYSAILNVQGGVIDDCVALRLDGETTYLVTNAGPLDAVKAQFAAHGVDAEDVTAATVKIDLQGPRSRDILIEAGLDAVAPLKYWQGGRTTWKGHDMIVSRSGYTGELGYELFISVEGGALLWHALLAHPEVRPCGLGARDTLRLEVGYPLYGEDASTETTPLEAGMDRFIQWDKDFIGKDVLTAQRARNDFGRLTAIRSVDRRAPRHAFEVKRDGEVLGVVTSGTFGPSVGCGVGLARLREDCTAPGTRLTAGPKDMPIETAEIPIYKGGTARKKLD
jgi:aminomethyltransferase